MRDVPIWKSSTCCYLGFKLLDHQEAHRLFSVWSCVHIFWIDFIFIYIKTDPQLINPEDIVTVTAGPFLDFTGSLLSENSTKEWNRTISHFVLRVSLCLLEVRVGGCRHRCIIDGERVSEQRWDFSPLCFFFFSLSIYSSRAAECHLLSHNWSRNVRCLFVATSVCLCVCQSTLHLHLETLWHFSYLKTLFICGLGNNYCCITIIIL